MAHVLIVDDEESMRVVLSRFLERDGYCVHTADAPLAALAILKDVPIDVVVCDLRLPRMSGVELLSHIREAAPHALSIIMTGLPTAETAAEAMREGAVDFLFKPVTREALLKAVNNAARIKSLDDERRRLAEANRVYQLDLERLVAERTHALQAANRQLQETLDELERTEQQTIQHERLSALGQMASGIAHDFNNALMPILAFSEILLHEFEGREGEEETANQLDMIHTAALDADSTVKRLREFYRPRQAGELHDLVNLNDVAQQVLALTRPKWRDEARANGVTIEVKTELQKVPAILGARGELHEVFTNLVFNAVDAMPEGGTLTLRTWSKNGGHVVFEVSDTGTGMSEDTQRRCMAPFFTTKRERGTGMGLAISHGIVRRHGGEVEITSELGAGTTFCLTLPVSSGSIQEVLGRESTALAQPLHVLVVDDEQPIREALMAYLTGDGHSVVAKASGDEGLRAFEEGWFDLVITDRAMPDMSGDRLADAIKSLAPGKPIILLTGFAETMRLEGCKPDAIDLVVQKPTTLDALRKGIEEVMRDA